MTGCILVLYVSLHSGVFDPRLECGIVYAAGDFAHYILEKFGRRSLYGSKNI